jgi:hypothetical protein
MSTYIYERAAEQTVTMTLPDTKGKEYVEVTEAITPIMENAKEMVSMS